MKSCNEYLCNEKLQGRRRNPAIQRSKSEHKWTLRDRHTRYGDHGYRDQSEKLMESSVTSENADDQRDDNFATY